MDKPILPVLFAVFTITCISASAAPANATPTNRPQIPSALDSWRDWATWNTNVAPPIYKNEKQRFTFWPAQLALTASANGAQFDVSLEVFHKGWVPLPGGNTIWPMQVKANGTAAPVIFHDNRPSLHLTPGKWRVTGAFQWAEIPQQIAIPKEIGILSLQVDGKAVEFPHWDAEGKVWLRRDPINNETEKDFVSVKIYRMIQDGIPMWLHTEVELVVSGKSREEDLGGVLPAGWELSSVEGALPSFIDDAGRMKVQVRPGKFTIRANAFRLNSPSKIGYAPGIHPATQDELVAFRAKPDFRLVEVTGIPAVDVSQTTFPQNWRDLPVYRWDTQTPFTLVERQRGMGLQKPEGLRLSRQLWLDENGKGFTFRDTISGTRQEIWRLDAASGQKLGAVRSNGEGQLVTLNPATGAPGVEIRTRNLNLEAVGRMDRSKNVSATGWQTDADALDITLMLPPGWRLLALFGADRVEGDWLTSWSLLDLFLLLIFTLAVFRMWGLGAGILAFFAFGLSYHEPDAPRYVWLALLIPIALLQMIPATGRAHRWVTLWKWVTVLILIFALAPFLARQIQLLIYPQLEFPEMVQTVSPNSPVRGTARLEESGKISAQQQLALSASLDKTTAGDVAGVPAPPNQDRTTIKAVDNFTGTWAKSRDGYDANPYNETRSRSIKANSNMIQAAGTRIQTGPGVPEWSWRAINIHWNSPVQAGQEIRPILIPLMVERIITLLRVVLLLALAGILINTGRFRSLFGVGPRMAAPTAAALLLLFLPVGTASAQFPDKELLNTLRERLLPANDAFPNAADISVVSLEVNGTRLMMDVEINAAAACGVPLPGRFPAWSPISVSLDGQPAAAVRRMNDFLWVVVPEGVHRVKIEGMLPATSDWELVFELKPHRITVNAPDWNVSGINKDGVPESQVFFSVKQKTSTDKASYDRQDLQSVAIVERNVEMGLVWNVRTTVRRITPRGKAIELRIPLLPGERVLSSNLLLENNRVEVRLGANDDQISWESELPVTETLALKTNAADTWVEQWSLVASPVWNLAFSGIAPIFNQADLLIPVWRPWPGEQVTWTIGRPEAAKGETTTIESVQHNISVGSRQNVTELTLRIRSSIGEDFPITLPEGAEITSLEQDGRSIPVRVENGKAVVPLRPGAQTVQLKWKTNVAMGALVRAEKVQLPVESSNAHTTLSVPENRWVLLTCGPLRGPAVQFWVILACSLIAGWALGRARLSPLSPLSWMVLAVGLTQVPLAAALLVVAWLFLLAWRGTESFQKRRNWIYNILQIILVILTAISLVIFISVVSAGLLGSPEMFILGNGSSANILHWFTDRCSTTISQPCFVSISIWWYRFLMLIWALWLAASLLRWLRWAWNQFTAGGAWHKSPKIVTPPPVPK